MTLPIDTKKSNPWVSFAIEMAPLLLFFISNAKWGIMVATAVFMAALPVSMVLSKQHNGKITPMLWVSAVVVFVFGGLTLILKDDIFIKLKPTVVSGLFAAVLLIGYYRGTPFLKPLMGPALPNLKTRGWMLLSRNWGYYFLVLAVLNEFVWRNFSTDTWVSYKVFGITPLGIIFALAQTPIILKYLEDPDAFKTPSDDA